MWHPSNTFWCKISSQLSACVQSVSSSPVCGPTPSLTGPQVPHCPQGHIPSPSASCRASLWPSRAPWPPAPPPRCTLRPHSQPRCSASLPLCHCQVSTQPPPTWVCGVGGGAYRSTSVWLLWLALSDISPVWTSIRDAGTTGHFWSQR